MTSAELDTTMRTYGHWRKPRSPGLPRLGTVGTFVTLFLLVLTVILQLRFGVAGGIAGIVLTVAVAVPLCLLDKAGRNGWQRIGSRLAWRLAQRRRTHIYYSSLTAPTAFGSCKLPGLLAASELLAFKDPYGNPFAVIYLPGVQHYTIMLRAYPEGSQLVDQSTIDTWVGHYGLWLRDLSHEANLVGASVTVESAPDPGYRLQAEVDRLMAPSAPPLARAVLNEAARTYPSGGAQISAHIALTFSAKRSKGEQLAQDVSAGGQGSKLSRVRTKDEMGVLLGTRLPSLVQALAMTGAGDVRPMQPAEVAEYVRVAYDPTSGDAMAQAHAVDQPADVQWDNAGPTAAVESWDAYRHDQVWSTTWQMVSAPTGLVQSDCLRPLLSTTGDALRKRVTMIYRPHDAATGAALADRDVRTAQNRITAGRDAKAHETVELRAALAGAQEEANGAGITRFSMLITATVDQPAKAPTVAEALVHQARASRIDLRPCVGTQAAAFSAALGVGIVPSSHINVPSVLRDNL